MDAAKPLLTALVAQVAHVSPTFEPRPFARLLQRATVATGSAQRRAPDPDDIRERCYGYVPRMLCFEDRWMLMRGRMVEKYSVLARDDLADALKMRIDALFPVHSETTLAMLALLLDLAHASALNKPLPAEFESTRVDSGAVAAQLTWREILSDEPFEGDHWIEPNYDDEDTATEGQSDESSNAPTAEDEQLPARDSSDDDEIINLRMR
ncbi:uncharacterized protein V1518DRAFT_242088 [Limtongia smithiae]|uniref:uncharacterized protein n=1 Tax=Limtongia smithiae TaxID=1125753 RepID=UPI0034CF8372